MAVELDYELCVKLAYQLARLPTFDAFLGEIYAEQRRAVDDWLRDNIADDTLHARIIALAIKGKRRHSNSLAYSSAQIQK